MALKPCKECGAPVSDEAKVCPQCGAKLQPKTTKVVWFAAIAMFAVLLPKCFMDKAAESEPVAPVATAKTSYKPLTNEQVQSFVRAKMGAEADSLEFKNIKIVTNGNLSAACGWMKYTTKSGSVTPYMRFMTDGKNGVTIDGLTADFDPQWDGVCS